MNVMNKTKTGEPRKDSFYFIIWDFTTQKVVRKSQFSDWTDSDYHSYNNANISHFNWGTMIPNTEYFAISNMYSRKV